MFTRFNKFISSKRLDSQLIPAILTLVVLIAVIYATQFYAQQDALGLYIRHFGLLGTVIYIISVVLANIAAPISATPLLILGHSIYGQTAIWMFALGNILAMAANFYIARRFGIGILSRLVGQPGMEKIAELSKDYGLIALFLVRVFLSGISDMTSYAFGLSTIRFRPYMIVSVVGALPPYLLLYNFSSSHQTALDFLLMQLAIAGILSAVLLASRFVKNWFLKLLIHG